MLALLKAIIFLPIAVIVILLSIANRGIVPVSFDPFARGAPEFVVNVPLYALVLGALAVGVVLGGTGAWLAAGRQRRSGRASRREANRLRRETDRLRTDLAETRTALPAPRRAA
ncbi:lipopolysaccharide assembly protein LapA domain-containing protein [Enterovirga rhinocerotis]|uniref:Uncharacterized protein DUF1049 n=1 Tax=Enterovirga rhinocerotis TaxID=1339210 RepID=A0A4R7BNU3_9HYPH|nr:LapA family protein [Enterovirga rhinocerotis]TDR87194.1 uncharacterized protein DUF1049 [Enterovirga rhinocerotis]